jgi:O-acetylserine/cysteine efflux transporter
MPVQHIVLALIVAVVWGVNFVVMKMGLSYLDPLLFVTVRFTIVLLLLFPFLKKVKGRMWKILQVGVCIGGLHFIFAITGIGLADHIASLTVITQLHVPFTLIMAYFFLGEKLSYWRTGGIVISFVGVLIITFDPIIIDERVAIGFIIVAVIFYSIGSILYRQLKDVGVWQNQAWTAVCAIPCLLPMTLIFETGQIEQVMNMDLMGWGLVFYTAVFASLVGYGGINYLFKHYNVSQVAPFLLTIPIFATIASVLLLDEVITQRFIFGSSVTLGGLGLIAFRDWWLKVKMSKEQLS